MFIYNLKLSGSLLFKIILSIIIFIVIFLCGIIGYKIYKASIKTNDDINLNSLAELNNENYSSVLKMVHDDIDSYIGQKIKFSGFVYRVYDLENEQFILGRNMIISSDFQTVIVGFLCNYKNAVKFKDYTWIELEGTITKGTYHDSYIPILNITNIKEIDKPSDEYVNPPDNNYVSTSVIL